MIEVITFGKDGRMYIVLGSMESKRLEMRLDENICAVFKADPNFNIDDLPDAENIRKILGKPIVHVFAGIGECQYTCPEEGTFFSRSIIFQKVAKIIWDKIHSVLEGIL